MTERRYAIAVDFDGVIHSYVSGWQGADVIPDPPVEGAIEWLSEMSQGFDLVILTTRGDQPGANAAIAAWLTENGYSGPMPEITSSKRPALIYIDDRGYRFEGTFPTAHEIHQSRPWNHARRA